MPHGDVRVDLSLGGYPYVTLAEARQKAFGYRKTARAGRDPRLSRRDVPTLEETAGRVIAMHRASWRPGGKSEAQWRASLRDYAMLQLGTKGVDEITAAEVMAVLLPIWSAKPETAERTPAHRSGVAREVAEAPLAHVVRDKVEAAYARGTHFERRWEVMERWGRYVAGSARPRLRRTVGGAIHKPCYRKVPT